MRPHRLRVTAFGAFGGTVAVDFDRLVDAGGLFLLHGETGAGKTTLLDAIGFALYGRVPGERGKARRLRSDHAPATVPTEVELDATIGGRRLRIVRRPEQVRPKLRGDGFTTDQARILVSEAAAAGQWRPVSTRAGEADQEIADLMGMSAEQFYQVVLLPQGQFAQFLHADAEGRGKLLQRLFGTDRFRYAEDWLAERRRTTAQEVAEAAQGIGQLCARIAEAGGVPLPAAPGDEDRWARELAESVMSEVARAQAALESSRLAVDAATGKLRAAERLADAQRRRADALRRRDELSASAGQTAALRDELAAAQRAAEVAAAIAAARRAETELSQARLTEDQARRAIEPGDADNADNGASAPELRTAAQERVRQAGRLEALRSLAEQAAAEDAAAAAARATAAELAVAVTSCQTELASAREKLRIAMTERDAAREAVAALPDSRAEADRQRRAADDAAALATARAEADRSRQAHIAAREHAVGLREEAARLREARIDGMRAELAATLVDRTPCPVCGALDHPEPCELRGDRVTREQEEAAVTAAERATQAAEAIGARLAAAQARIDELSRRLAGIALDATAAELDLAARASEAEAQRLAAATSRLPALQATADALGKAIADAETRSAEMTQQRTAELAKGDSADRRAADHRDRLREQLGGATDLAAALTAARGIADALSRAADAADATARAVSAAESAREAAEKAAAEAGFASIDEAGQAAREAGWRETAAASIREHETATAAVATLLAENDVALEPEADVAATATAARQRSAAYDEAVSAHARAQRQHEQLARLVPGLGRALTAFAPLAGRAAQIRQLADLAAGQGANTLRMTLSSFVLAARLEEVAAAASQRLLRMTAGRYSLVHTDARRGGGRSGLRLLACDAWTGHDRDTSTLSGGETFMASLALALGLADVVTEEAGGGRIEALFVDEGFGSLDEETLEEVMNVLDGLREGGRLVGIVSHVTELRQRIPAQIQVRKTHTGSHLATLSLSARPGWLLARKMRFPVLAPHDTLGTVGGNVMQCSPKSSDPLPSSSGLPRSSINTVFITKCRSWHMWG